MSLNSLIIQTLKPTGVPAVFQVYTGTQTTYITFFEYNEMGTSFAEDAEQTERRSIQVDIWSKGNYADLVKQVRKLMTDAGFTRNSGTESYEDDTKVFHKVFRFYYEVMNN
ncbi:hypothetical protein FQ087_18695 [Sporosarcina sp. ANT_H38]|uniref:hypothetical protein n=1 Tax=Sporosarcina sp. ANT_H38 TaxID=2597358 RepID=UPI0011F2FC86|nr:hypothetical protein [Sporosarcina sp. ANT_H38]KAA0944154.1 hypothetical protein FQ087_18695 [Sporosarcina sp. ANT_H38]